MNASEKELGARLLTAVIWIALCWAVAGLAVLAVSNVILLTGNTDRYGFLPIDPRNNVVTALLCLVPAAIGVVSVCLRMVLRRVT